MLYSSRPSDSLTDSLTDSPTDSPSGRSPPPRCMTDRTPDRPTMPSSLMTRQPIRPLSRALLVASLAFAVLLPAFAASAATDDELAALVEAGRSTEAWALCADLDPVANPRSDLWCGIAATDIGRAGWGVLALERYSLQFRNDARAQLELARAYFYAGDDIRARQEFEAVAKRDPPPVVRAGIVRYLDALASREGRYQRRIRAWIEAGVGWDSNANAGVAQADITLPVLGRVSVVDEGVKKSDSFGWLAGSASIDQPVAPGVTVSGGVWGSGTFYRDLNEFNLGTLGAMVGGSYLSGPNIYALTYAHGEILLDGSKYRATDGIGAEWRRQLSERSMLSIAPQFARLDYDGANSVRDSDLSAISVAFHRWWLTTWQPVLSVTGYAGDEHNRRDRPDLGRKLWGAGVELTTSPSTQWALTVGANYLRSNYDGATPLIDATRHDDNWVANLGATYFLTRNWSARLDYQYARNNSDLALYEYTRHVVAAKIRYDFK